MDRNALRAVVFAVATGWGAMAMASPVVVEDPWDPADITFPKSGAPIPYTFTHDFNDQGLGDLLDDVTELTLILRFYDQDGDRQPEKVWVWADGTLLQDVTIGNGSTLADPTVAYLHPAPDLVRDDGLLEVILVRQVGDFVFMDSILAAVIDPGVPFPAAVQTIPEPPAGHLAVLALGLAGLARRTRRAS